ncbi:hypothetical protein RB195_006642 [Necator americanus]
MKDEGCRNKFGQRISVHANQEEALRYKLLDKMYPGCGKRNAPVSRVREEAFFCICEDKIQIQLCISPAVLVNLHLQFNLQNCLRKKLDCQLQQDPETNRYQEQMSSKIHERTRARRKPLY